MSASQGEKIIRLQNLFKTYSSLAFTNASDRPVAVGGIQNCLLKAFDTQGGYGIFGQDDEDSNRKSRLGQRGLLRRSLLWYRPPNKEPLTPIRFPPDQEVPSWSWMAYVGEIDFLRPGFGIAEWLELQSPWPGSRTRAKSALLLPGGGPVTHTALLKGKIRDIVSRAETGSSGHLFYDIPELANELKLQCLVLGVEKGTQGIGERRHYFIIVQPAKVSTPRLGLTETVYRRIGAGYLPGKFISDGGQDGQVV